LPIYEYRCNECGVITQLLEGIGRDRPVRQCASCAGKDLARLISRPNLGIRGGDNRNDRIGNEQAGLDKCTDPGWPNDDFIRLKGQS
jgi:putative FmdB family regulatory protein